MASIQDGRDDGSRSSSLQGKNGGSEEDVGNLWREIASIVKGASYCAHHVYTSELRRQ